MTLSFQLCQSREEGEAEVSCAVSVGSLDWHLAGKQMTSLVNLIWRPPVIAQDQTAGGAFFG